MGALNDMPSPEHLHDDEGRANRIAARKHLRVMKLENPDKWDRLQREWKEGEGITAFREIQSRAIGGESS